MGTLINTGINYRVREGDSLFSIATRFFSSIPHILSVNPDIDHGILYTISNTLATH
jgi:spore germination protein YaaH